MTIGASLVPFGSRRFWSQTEIDLVEGTQYSIYQKRDQKIEQTPGPGENDSYNSHIFQLNLGMEAKVSIVRHPRWGQMGKSTDKDMETQISTASREESSLIFWRNNILSLLSIHSFIHISSLVSESLKIISEITFSYKFRKIDFNSIWWTTDYRRDSSKHAICDLQANNAALNIWILMNWIRRSISSFISIFDINFIYLFVDDEQNCKLEILRR